MTLRQPSEAPRKPRPLPTNLTLTLERRQQEVLAHALDWLLHSGGGRTYPGPPCNLPPGDRNGRARGTLREILREIA